VYIAKKSDVIDEGIGIYDLGVVVNVSVTGRIVVVRTVVFTMAVNVAMGSDVVDSGATVPVEVQQATTVTTIVDELLAWSPDGIAFPAAQAL
jgi:hypothetical protein